MAKAICWRNQGRHLQARQEGLQAITHWCPPQRYLRCWQVPLLDWIQDPPCSQIHGSCPRTSRRSLLHDQGTVQYRCFFVPNGVECLPENVSKWHFTLKYLLNFQKRAVGMRKHLERNRKDKDGKFRLILIESRIHRLSRYYRAKGIVPPTFKYESATASALVA